MNKPLILVVEDDPAVARLISTTLETRNYQYHRVPVSYTHLTLPTN
mgnify:CR=1 FL=1